MNDNDLIQIKNNILKAIEDNDSSKIYEYCNAHQYKQAMVKFSENIEKKIQEKSNAIRQQQQKVLSEKSNLKSETRQKSRNTIQTLQKSNTGKQKEFITNAKKRITQEYSASLRELRYQSRVLKLAERTNQAVNLMIQSTITMEKMQNRNSDLNKANLGNQIKSFFSNLAKTIKTIFTSQKMKETIPLQQNLQQNFSTVQKQSSLKQSTSSNVQQSQKANNKILKQTQQSLNSIHSSTTSTPTTQNTPFKNSNNNSRVGR